MSTVIAITPRRGHRARHRFPMSELAARRPRLRNARHLLPGDVAAVLDAHGWLSLAQAAKARRLTVVAAEDVAAYATAEILALRDACERERKARRGPPTRVFVAKAIVILCKAAKSRDADHLTNLIVDRLDDSDPQLLGALIDAESDLDALPAWVYDCHTSEGRRMGKNRRDFFESEHAALVPRLPGLFDHLIDDLRDE